MSTIHKKKSLHRKRKTMYKNKSKSKSFLKRKTLKGGSNNSKKLTDVDAGEEILQGYIIAALKELNTLKDKTQLDTVVKDIYTNYYNSFIGQMSKHGYTKDNYSYDKYMNDDIHGILNSLNYKIIKRLFNTIKESQEHINNNITLSDNDILYILYIMHLVSESIKKDYDIDAQKNLDLQFCVLDQSI